MRSPRRSINRQTKARKILVTGSELRKIIRSASLKSLFGKKISRKDCLTVEQIWKIATEAQNPGVEEKALKHLKTCKLCRDDIDSIKQYFDETLLRKDFNKVLKAETGKSSAVEKKIRKVLARARTLGISLFD